MKKITKILCLTDFSDPSANAFQYTLELADVLDAEITVQHVIFPQGESLDYPMAVAEMTKQRIKIARDRLALFVKNNISKLDSKLKENPDCTYDVAINSIVNSINSKRVKENYNFIVIASRGENRSSIEKIFGSVTESVVEKSPIPVMVIPEAAKFNGIKTMTYATEMNNYTPFEIWRSVQLLSPISPIIHVVHIDQKRGEGMIAKEKLEEMAAFFEGKPPGLQLNFHNIYGKDLNQELNNFAKQHETDILVMYQPTHNLWERLFLRSTTKEMAIVTEFPLLIQKEQ